MLSKILEFLKSILSFDVKPAKTEPTPVKTVVPPITKGTISRKDITLIMADEFSKIAGSKEQGNNTDNGGNIDKVIKTTGGRLGWPYCAMTVTYITMKTCERLGIGYPKGLYRGASSQAFMSETSPKYISKIFSEWSAFVHSNNPPDGHGHVGLGTKLIDALTFKTAEGNFQQQINYFTKTYSYVNKFVDIPQAILDQYNLEHK